MHFLIYLIVKLAFHGLQINFYLRPYKRNGTIRDGRYRTEILEVLHKDT